MDTFFCPIGVQIRGVLSSYYYYVSLHRETVGSIQDKIGKKIFETVLRYNIHTCVNKEAVVDFILSLKFPSGELPDSTSLIDRKDIIQLKRSGL